MATKSMKVTGMTVQSATKYDLRGGGLGSNLKKITVTLDSTPPPVEGAATGLVGDQAADIYVSPSVWADVNTMINSFPFKATVHFTGTTTVTGLTFDELPASLTAIAEDVRVLRKYGELISRRFSIEHDDVAPAIAAED